MNCPNCGAPEHARARVCQSCGTAYASEDLLELRQLEFLLQETAAWPEADARRQPYGDRLATLRARLVPPAVTPVTALATAATPVTAPVMARAAAARTASVGLAAAPSAAAGSAAATPPAAPAQPAPAAPRPESVPFDQWLLSEGTIKAALYSGGALLILAGLIFVSVNWGRIPGPAKFMVTLLATGLMYLGGYLLFQRPGLKLGGVAVLGVASGFLPLNFVVLQIYIFSAQGLSANAMWLIGSLPVLLLYALTALWTQADFFTYLSLGALVSAATAAMVLLGAPLLAFGLVYSVLALAVLLVARALQATRLAPFTRLPLLIVAQAAAVGLFVVNAFEWMAVTSGYLSLDAGSPWLPLAGMLVGVSFYILTDLVWHWRLARWAGAFAFALATVFLITQLGVTGQLSGIALMVLALAYLLLGYALQDRARQPAAGSPLYAAGYALALFVTLQAVAGAGTDLDGLAKTLIGDVILLAVSAWVHKQYGWVYGAVWLLGVPVFIYASLYLPGLANQGLVLGILMLNEAAAGYALGRRKLRWGAPFLTAAAGLSVVVVALTWGNAALVSFVLGVVALLYLLGALWLGVDWIWLLLPALVAINLAALTILRSLPPTGAPPGPPLTITYGALGLVVALGGIALRRGAQRRWAWPLYLVAALDLAGAYVAALFLGGTLAIVLSAALVLLALYLTWFERATLDEAKLPPVFTYLAAGLLFVGHFYVIHLSRQTWFVWQDITAGLCALLVLAAGLLRGPSLLRLYSTPLRRAGLWLLLVPLVAVVYLYGPPAAPRLINPPIAAIGAVAYAIAGFTLAADGAARRSWRLGYLGAAALVVVIWWLLLYFRVSNQQAYAIPPGVFLLVLGWNERRRGHPLGYRWSTLLGLVILMGTAFEQSLSQSGYALLLLVESLAAVAWGIRTRSRGYVQLGGLALIVNAVAQLGPSFVELPRWIQIGAIGTILLGGGLAALLRREQILTARRALGKEWKSWQA